MFIRQLLNRLYEFAGALAAVNVFFIFILMIYASVGRSFHLRVSWVNDVVSWLCAAAAFLGMAYSFRNGDFVRVTLLLERLPISLRKVLEIISLLIALVSITYLMYWVVLFTYESWSFKDMAGNMVAIPIWIPQMSLVIGTFIFWVAVIDECVGMIQGKTPRYISSVLERHARGDFSEDL